MVVTGRTLSYVVIGCVAAAPVWAADHREAPRIDEFPPADINDVYVFKAPISADRLVLAMTVSPLGVPEFATSYSFSPRVFYRLAIDNDGDAVPDTKIDVRFSEPEGGVQNFKATFPGNIQVEGQTTPPTVLDDEPNDPVIASGPPGSGIKVFAGPRDDPFFFDLVGFNRFVAGAGTFSGDNNFEGFNVLAIVLQFPPDLVAEGSDQIGVFGLTVRRNPGEYPSDDRRLDRMGNPAVQTAFIPTELDDEFNRSLPVNDERNFGDVIVSSLQEFGTSEENIDILASVAVPDTLKLDLTRPVEYPNGRALDDDVIDILLSLVLNGPMGDGADSNDRSFLDTFPYLAPPFQAP